MNKMVKTAAVAATLVATVALSSTASAFWNPKDWDMQDGWGNGSNHPMAPMGWGSNDKRGPFGGENGWGAVDSMMDSMGMGDAMSDLNTDVEWDLNMDTKLKGKASGEGKAKGKSENRATGKGRSDVRHYSDNYYRPYGPTPYYNAPPAAQVPYGYAPYPYPPQMMGPSGGAVPFAPAMPQQMMPQQMQQQQMMVPPAYWRR